jgi:hypothetical protein
LPTGTKIKIYVGDKFEDESIVNVYHYSNTKKSLDFVKSYLKVKDGYVEFDLEHCSEYFVTMSTIAKKEVKETSSINIFVIFTIIEAIIIVGLVAFIFIKFKKNRNIDILKTDVNEFNNNINNNL